MNIKKTYVRPQSRAIMVRTEQGICSDSNQAAKLEDGSHVDVEEYTTIENDVTFE